MSSEQGAAPCWQIYIGKAQEVMPAAIARAARYDACITGPPGFSSGGLAKPGDVVGYVRAIEGIGRQIRTLLYAPGWWWLLQGAHHSLVPCSVEAALERDGWTACLSLGHRQAVNTSHDFVTLLTAKPIDQPYAINSFDASWSLPPLTLPGFRFPVLPPALIRACLRALSLKPGAVIFDPFCGSAQVGVVALQCGYSFVGVEADARTAELADQRLAATAAALVPEPSSEAVHG